MVKKSAKTTKSTANQVAEKAKPNWRAIEPASAAADVDLAAANPDATCPEVDVLMTKYFGASKAAADAALGQKAKPQKAAPKTSKMVVMEPKTAADVRPGRKVMLVEDGEVVGEQG